MNIVLIGFMGTGKSAVGRNLARRLDARHLDTDAEIERTAGRLIPQIFADEGEAAFRARESAFLSSLAPTPNLAPPQASMVVGVGRPLILSTGGGTPLRPENAALLKKIGLVIWLRPSAETIFARVRKDLHERPLLASHAADPLARIRALLAEREARYEAAADWQLDTSDCVNADEAAGRVLALLAHTQE